MTKNIESHDENIRDQIKAFLSAALQRTIRSYEAYESLSDSEKINFERDHKSVQAAFRNIKFLLELAEAANIPDQNGDGMELAVLLQQASAELDKFENGAGNE